MDTLCQSYVGDQSDIPHDSNMRSDNRGLHRGRWTIRWQIEVVIMKLQAVHEIAKGFGLKARE